jgi:hypothetical protein
MNCVAEESGCPRVNLMAIGIDSFDLTGLVEHVPQGSKLANETLCYSVRGGLPYLYSTGDQTFKYESSHHNSTFCVRDRSSSPPCCVRDFAFK